MISAPAWQSTAVVGPLKDRFARGQDWASRAEEWDADDYLRRLVYLAVNTLILSLTVSGLLSLDTLGEALISELAGVPVYEHCDRGAKPRCCFEVAPFESIAQD